MTNKTATTPVQVFASLQRHVPASLLQYWLYRFVDPKTGNAFAEAEALARPGGKSLETRGAQPRRPHARGGTSRGREQGRAHNSRAARGDGEVIRR